MLAAGGYDKRMNRLWWWIVGGVAAAGMVLIVVLLLAPKSPIAPGVRKQLTSTFMAPVGGGAVVDRESANYLKDSKVLIYNVKYAGTRIILSEQSTPDQFVDIPQVYAKLTDSMGNYKTFDVSLGTVHLTKLKDGDKQVAVLNSSGTLLFAKPDRDLSDDEWRVFFVHLRVMN